MVNWYYVLGSERVGPVAMEVLKELFKKEEITLETYVWRKGFQNWEHLKDVEELNFTALAEKIVPKKAERRNDKVIEKNIEPSSQSESSPEINFSFHWESVKEDEEIFFIKIGHDRKTQLATDLFGPYSINELKDAINDKRINNHSLIFAAGMPGWVEVGDTPLDPKNLKLNTKNVLDETPLLVVFQNDHMPLIALVQEAGLKKCTLLGAGHFPAGKEVICSMYSGMVLKAKNLKLNIDQYNPHDQKVFCSVIEISEAAKKIMQNYAE
jgi:uncharacterized membrane protein